MSSDKFGENQAGQAEILLDNQPVMISPGTTILQYLQQKGQIDPGLQNPVVIMSINGRRASLHEAVHGDERVRLIRLKDIEANTTIQRTVLFVMAVAAEDLFPDHRLRVNFSYGGGVYCELVDSEPLSIQQIRTLEERMGELVSMDLPLTPQRFGLRALLKMLQRDGKHQRFTSAKYLRRDTVTLFRMNGFDQLYFGRQLPSTGYVRAFRLVPEGPGFVLMTNVKQDPEMIPTYVPQSKLLTTMRKYSAWSAQLSVQDVGHMNEYIVDGNTSDLVQISEARHSRFFVDAADQVAAMPDDGRLILLAGPSSSGKTSSAKRLAIQLRVLGLRPFALSLDNYFVDREDTPLDEEGDYDFESIDALKVDLFNEHLKALMAGEPVHLPTYNFHTGTSSISEHSTVLEKGMPLLVEGIHALNPKLTPAINDAEKLRIYVSALCHMNIDNFSYIKTTDTRLFRRIVRDAQFRGYTASETLARWPKVRLGEEEHIFPFQNNADLFFNSGLTYELAVLKLWAEPRLAAVDPDDKNYGLARTLIDLLSLLLPVDASQVPPTSLLREFIGGSGFHY
jgi:uridine kinase